MAGCYGSHPEDLQRERELDRYTDSLAEDNEDEPQEIPDVD